MNRALKRLSRLLELKKRELRVVEEALGAKIGSRRIQQERIATLRQKGETQEAQWRRSLEPGVLDLSLLQLHTREEADLKERLRHERAHLRILRRAEEAARHQYLEKKRDLEVFERLHARRLQQERARLAKLEMERLEEAARYRYLERQKSPESPGRERPTADTEEVNRDE